jgi:organic hydroperoxide reductase OsmC/OhrA
MATEHVHSYKTAVEWRGNQGFGTRAYTAYGRDFIARIAGKPDLLGSADPAFRGDVSRHNPEDLLVIALSSCHMLSYLHVCATSRIVVTAYVDEASGTMVTELTHGRFREVTLRPQVTVAADTSDADVERAKTLHAEASRGCFIAASVSFPVRHEPRVVRAT